MNEYPTRPPTREEALAQRLAVLGQQRVARSSPGDRFGPQPPPPPRAPNRRSRRHPAARARAAAIGLSLASAAGLTAFFAIGARGAGTQIIPASVVSGQSASSAAPSPATGSTPTVTATPVGPAASAATTTTAASTGADAVVDGGVFQNRWGEVQVEATFGADGKLASITAVKTPNGQGKSIQINSSAVPTLTTEALTAQSAQVDSVSGATYTSNDYRRSLQSAIDAARAANITGLT